MNRLKIAVVLGFTIFLTGCVNTPTGNGLFVPTPVVGTDGRTNTVYIVNPGVTTTLQTARDVSGAIPSPYTAIAAAALAVLSGVLGIIAKRKSDKAALLPVVIAGIEAVGEPESIDVKKSIQKIASATGLEARLNVEVQRVTRDMVV